MTSWYYEMENKQLFIDDDHILVRGFRGVGRSVCVLKELNDIIVKAKRHNWQQIGILSKGYDDIQEAVQVALKALGVDVGDN